MQFAMYTTMFLCAVVLVECLEMLSSYVSFWKVHIPIHSILINFILILFSIYIIRYFFLEPLGAVDLCRPSPCGPNSQCRVVNQQAICSCVQGYLGAPPSCRPECVVSSDCPRNLACNNQKCIDPCTGTCGLRTQCQVVNHNPICSCLPRYSGDPFTRCDLISKEYSRWINLFVEY